MLGPAIDDEADRLAGQLAAALTSADFTRAAELFSDGVSLWTSSRGALVPCGGRAQVVGALRRLLSLGTPTRIRVLRKSSSSAVLAAWAGEDALWSLELTIAPPCVDAIMVWIPATPAAATLS